MQIEYYHDRYGRMHEYDWDKTLDLIKTLLKDGKNLKKYLQE